MNVIEIKNLQKTYYSDDVETPALRGVSFNVEKGDFVSIMGPSGSGKSTLLHLLGFLDQPTGGEYIFDGKKIEKYTDDDLARFRNKKLGFVFQAFNLLSKITVLENVKLPLIYSGIDESKWNDLATKAIEKVGLSHRINHDANKLSGGEKQRVAIARALVNEPQVIFADEPTGNLDSASGLMIMNYIEKLHHEGTTIILVTHETYTARYAHRIIHLKDGLIENIEEVEETHGHTSPYGLLKSVIK
jgi:putative ABC transport system ATP-binding protein